MSQKVSTQLLSLVLFPTLSLSKGLFLFLFLQTVSVFAQQDSLFPFPIHNNIIATVFWVGEKGNESSSWDQNWEKHFGGFDDPKNRNGWNPSGFTPKENPFYVALPFNDVGTFCNNGSDVKAGFIDSCTGGKAFFKNRWVKITSGDSICFAQWEDVGPFVTCDIPFVFGNEKPINAENDSAGIDLSPATASYLGIKGKGKVTWQFVNKSEVSPGPWLTILTTSKANWD